MKFHALKPPRKYQCGFEIKRTISDCARLELQPDEQITLLTESGAEYDVTRKEFGFYATPSTNGRLASFNLKTVLAVNRQQRVYVFLVEQGKEETFIKYIREEQMHLICRLDNDQDVRGFLKRNMVHDISLQ